MPALLRSLTMFHAIPVPLSWLQPSVTRPDDPLNADNH